MYARLGLHLGGGSRATETAGLHERVAHLGLPLLPWCQAESGIARHCASSPCETSTTSTWRLSPAALVRFPFHGQARALKLSVIISPIPVFLHFMDGTVLQEVSEALGVVALYVTTVVPDLHGVAAACDQLGVLRMRKVIGVHGVHHVLDVGPASCYKPNSSRANPPLHLLAPRKPCRSRYFQTRGHRKNRLR